MGMSRHVSDMAEGWASWVVMVVGIGWTWGVVWWTVRDPIVSNIAQSAEP